MSHDDEMARMRAEVDQAKAGLAEVAGSCWAFYAALLDEGFDAGQAIKITVAWLTAMITKSSEPDV